MTVVVVVVVVVVIIIIINVCQFSVTYIDSGYNEASCHTEYPHY